MSKIILAGCAASGKDFLRDYLVKVYRLEPEVSFTTRPIRRGETNGETYHFIPEYAFVHLKATGFFYECVNFAKMWYGTSKHSWGNSDIMIMTPMGISQIRRRDRKDCLIVYLNIPHKSRLERLQDRSDWDSAERRIKADEQDFKDFTDFDLSITDPQFNLERVSKHIIELVKQIKEPDVI